MAMVVLRTPPLSSDQKKRIGDRILGALHHEGIPAASAVILFQAEDADLYLDGGLFYEAARPGSAAPPPKAQPVPVQAPEEPQEAPISFLPAASAKPRGRRSKSELSDLKDRLVQLLQMEGALSSFDAQTRLNLKDSDGAPATLRRFFTELEEEGFITKQGQKRGTRYVWKGIVQNSAPALPPVRLVKRAEDEEA